MLILNSVLPLEAAEQSLTAWPIVFMMFSVAFALIVMPIAMNWFLDSDYNAQWVQVVLKSAQIALLLVCLAITVFVPYKVISNADTPGGAWSLFLGFVLIGVLFGFWLKQFEMYSRRAWFGAGLFIALCFIITVVVSVALLLTSLVAQVVALPAAGLVALLIIGFAVTQRN
ncbi:hypothetical protein [Glutamicibacter ardleyensis]|uniref:hypothetical protein n=1 Tax=Glutamicibacter ardleyensis TaxID=225894 RepID=UPI003FD04065